MLLAINWPCLCAAITASRAEKRVASLAYSRAQRARPENQHRRYAGENAFANACRHIHNSIPTLIVRARNGVLFCAPTCYYPQRESSNITPRNRLMPQILHENMLLAKWRMSIIKKG